MQTNKRKTILHRIAGFCLAVAMMLPMAAQLVPPASAEETPDPDIDLLFESRSIINNTKHPRFKMMYRLYVPEGYKEKKYPIVLHLNGNGQDGSDNVKHLKSAKNFPTLLMKGDNPKKYPCIILAPQCPSGEQWVDNFYGDISRPLDLAMDLVSLMIEKYNGDPSRIYVTGYSTGATACWDVMNRYPYTIAAALPFAGYTAPSTATRIKNIPIWVFHADKDPMVPVAQSRQMVDALRAVNGKIRYTELDSTEHGASWISAFNNPTVLPWLFSQKSTNTMPPSDYTGGVPINGDGTSSSPAVSQAPNSGNSGTTGQASSTTGGKGTSSNVNLTYDRTKADIVDQEEPVTEEARKEAQALLEANPYYKEDPVGTLQADGTVKTKDGYASAPSNLTTELEPGETASEINSGGQADVFDPNAQQKKNNIALIAITTGICVLVAAGVIVCIVLYKKGILFKEKGDDEE